LEEKARVLCEKLFKSGKSEKSKIPTAILNADRADQADLTDFLNSLYPLDLLNPRSKKINNYLPLAFR